MVDCFLFHHTKPKKKKQKTKLLWLSLNLKRLKEKGVKMELGIMVWVRISVAAAWMSDETVDLLERFYFSVRCGVEYTAWLRVMCAGLLLVFIQVAPQFYTSVYP